MHHHELGEMMRFLFCLSSSISCYPIKPSVNLMFFVLLFFPVITLFFHVTNTKTWKTKLISRPNQAKHSQKNVFLYRAKLSIFSLNSLYLGFLAIAFSCFSSISQFFLTVFLASPFDLSFNSRLSYPSLLSFLAFGLTLGQLYLFSFSFWLSSFSSPVFGLGLLVFSFSSFQHSALVIDLNSLVEFLSFPYNFLQFQRVINN